MIESSLPQSEPVLLPSRPFGRQVRSVIGYSLLTALMVITQTVVFVPAALLNCAARHGRRAAWAVLVLSIAICSLYALVADASVDQQKMSWSYLASVTFAIALPSIAAVPMVRRGEPFGRVLLTLLAGAVVGLVITEFASQMLLAFSPYAALTVEAKEVFRQILELYRDAKVPSEMIRSAQRVEPVSLYLLPAQMVIGLIVTFVLSLMMFGRLRALQNDPERPYLFRGFALPEWLLFAFIFGGITPLATGMLQMVAGNVLAVVGVLYVLQGLAVLRSILLSIGAGLAGTLFSWGLLVITLPFSLLALAVTGLFDSFFDFRHFKKRKDDSHESHSD